MKRVLRDIPLPDEQGAEERAWQVVSAAFAGREPTPWPKRRARLILIGAVGLAVVAAALSPPGMAFLGSVRDRVTGRHAGHGLVELPAGGRLLVNSARGPWIVQRDGSRRLLGPYAGASWSPHGLFVVAVRGDDLLALDPKGNVRWTISRRQPVSSPRWSPDGFRIAYLSGRALHVVAGDGTGDRLLATNVSGVAPAWAPGDRHVLAFSDRRGRVSVEQTDTRSLYWRSEPGEAPVQLAWAPDGFELVALARHSLRVLGKGTVLGELRFPRRTAVAAAFSPAGNRLALIRDLTGQGRAEVVSLAVTFGARPAVRRVFAAAGDFSGLAWSPDGRWLLLAWRSADQWLFVRATGVQRIVTASAIASRFDPGGTPPSFPELAGWCC